MKAQKKAPKATRPRHFSVPMKAKSRSGNNGYGNSPQALATVSSNGGQYGGQNIALHADREYLTMVVQRHGGEWGYVRVNQHCLDVVQTPCVFDANASDELLEIWKRVVLDNAIPWEDSVRPETLRIVSYKMQVEDKTLSLFNDDAEVNEFLRMSAMAKLSDAEARLLGLSHAKAKQIIMHNPNFHRDDSVTLGSLQKVSASLPLDTMMAHLSA